MQRILLVDRDDSLRRALARTLRSAGFEVGDFAAFDDALAHAAGADALVVEADGPWGNGIDFAMLRNAAASGLPLVVLTASGREEIGARLAPLAPSAVLHKPFERDALIAALAQAGLVATVPPA